MKHVAFSATLGLIASVSTTLVASSASAHLGLTTPPSRYGRNVLKEGPCGQGNGERSENVTVYEPGETITLVWDEYIDHPGHFRIAFDEDGADDFEDPVCVANCEGPPGPVEPYPEFEEDQTGTVLKTDIPDSEEGGAGFSGGVYEIEVTLPDVECHNCTLQVIQVMYDKRPYPADGPDDDLYYQCADLVLERSGGGGTDAGTGAGGNSSQTDAGPAGAGGTGSSDDLDMPVADSGGSGGTAGSSGTADMGGDGSEDPSGVKQDGSDAGTVARAGGSEGGCSVSHLSVERATTWVWALAAWVWARRRKRDALPSARNHA